MKISNTATPKHLMPITVLLGSCILALGIVTAKRVEMGYEHMLTVSVTGQERIQQKPDVARITLGFQTDRLPTASQAMSDLEASMQSVVAALSEQGIREADIQTSGLNMYPATDWVDGQSVPRGYQASQNVTVKVRELDNLSSVITSVTEAGANQISGVEFIVENLDQIQAMARQAAIQEADRKIEALGQTLRRKIGRMTEYSETISAGNQFPMPMMEARGLGGGGADSMPSGTDDVTVMVRMTYQLK